VKLPKGDTWIGDLNRPKGHCKSSGLWTVCEKHSGREKLFYSTGDLKLSSCRSEWIRLKASAFKLPFWRVCGLRVLDTARRMYQSASQQRPGYINHKANLGVGLLHFLNIWPVSWLRAQVIDCLGRVNISV